jgi:hypothetical protein
MNQDSRVAGEVRVMVVEADDLKLDRILAMLEDDIPQCIVDTEGLYYRIVSQTCAEFIAACHEAAKKRDRRKKR